MKKAHLLAILALPMLSGLNSCGDLTALTSGLTDAVIQLTQIAATTAPADGTTAQDYDENGYPIYGQDDQGAVYGYDAQSNPIYSVQELSNAVQVPTWAPTGAAASSPLAITIYQKPSLRRAKPPVLAQRRHKGKLHASIHHTEVVKKHMEAKKHHHSTPAFGKPDFGKHGAKHTPAFAKPDFSKHGAKHTPAFTKPDFGKHGAKPTPPFAKPDFGKHGAKPTPAFAKPGKPDFGKHGAKPTPPFGKPGAKPHGDKPGRGKHHKDD